MKSFSRHGVKSDPHKLHALKEMPSLKTKKSFPGILNYFSKFFPATAEVCKPPCQLTSGQAELTWSKSKKDLYNQIKVLIKQDAHMKFYETRKPLYLEKDPSGVELNTGLLKGRDEMNCTNEET